MRRVLSIGLTLLSGCSAESSASPPPIDGGSPAQDAATLEAALAPPDPLITERPYELREPADYDRAKPAGLVIGLHGYGAGDNATAFEKWLALSSEASKRGILYALPSGSLDKTKNPFWNATDACCNFYGSKVDDVAYLSAVIDDVARIHPLDRGRVYVVGVSGGGFMAHRLACDLSDRIAAIVSISGSTWNDDARCQPKSPVALLEMHGDADSVVHYEGGVLLQSGADYPGVRATVERWKKPNGCTGTLTERPGIGPLDVESSVAGPETTVETYDSCAGADVELWTAKGGPHAPRFTRTFAPTLFDWLERHPKKPGGG